MLFMLLKHLSLKQIVKFLSFLNGNQFLIFGFILVGMIFNSHNFKLFQEYGVNNLRHCERHVFLGSIFENIHFFIEINSHISVIDLFFSLHIVNKIIIHINWHTQFFCTLNFRIIYFIIIEFNILKLITTVFVHSFLNSLRRWRAN